MMKKKIFSKFDTNIMIIFLLDLIFKFVNDLISNLGLGSDNNRSDHIFLELEILIMDN